MYYENKSQGTDMVDRIVRQLAQANENLAGIVLGQRTNMYTWSLKFFNAKWTNKTMMDGQWTLADSVYCVNTNEKLKVHAGKL